MILHFLKMKIQAVLLLKRKDGLLKLGKRERKAKGPICHFFSFFHYARKILLYAFTLLKKK